MPMHSFWKEVPISKTFLLCKGIFGWWFQIDSIILQKHCFCIFACDPIFILISIFFTVFSFWNLVFQLSWCVNLLYEFVVLIWLNVLICQLVVIYFFFKNYYHHIHYLFVDNCIVTVHSLQIEKYLRQCD